MLLDLRTKDGALSQGARCLSVLGEGRRQLSPGPRKNRPCSALAGTQGDPGLTSELQIWQMIK